MMMKFSILDLLWTTTAVAILFALLRSGAYYSILAFVVLTLMQIILPLAIVFAAIAFADQRGPMLDVSTLAGWQLLKKIWCLSILCTLVVWAMLFLAIAF